MVGVRNRCGWQICERWCSALGCCLVLAWRVLSNARVLQENVPEISLLPSVERRGFTNVELLMTLHSQSGDCCWHHAQPSGSPFQTCSHGGTQQQVLAPQCRLVWSLMFVLQSLLQALRRIPRGLHWAGCRPTFGMSCPPGCQHCRLQSCLAVESVTSPQLAPHPW